MKNISGYFSRATVLLLALILFSPARGQDTLRTFGPRFGIDLARFIYILADPSEAGAEFSADFEIYKNIYPVLELGYSSISESEELFDYQASGLYFRGGIDYNILPRKNRSAHHSITVGFRYGISPFTHRIENMLIHNKYWGDYQPGPYENSLTGHWLELAGGMKAEVLPNFFLGWSVRYKLLLNENMDPLLVPELIPGFGSGGEKRSFGFSYSVFYKIPLIKK
ncbi:MAG: DUF6048 family protein [Bacteroidales bacterium]|nr:DUF6048 family protein [Bacteroidales bacterium]